MNNDTSDDRQALLAFLPVVRSNQELYMSQRWKTTNYALLLYGSIVYILNGNNFCIGSREIIIIFAISSAICLLAIYVTHRLEKSVKECRIMATRIYEKISILKNILEGQHETSLRWIFYAIIVLGYAYVLWTLLSKSVVR